MLVDILLQTPVYWCIQVGYTGCTGVDMLPIQVIRVAGKNVGAGGDTVVVFPNGHTPPPLPPHTIETHGPYQHGAGFKTVPRLGSPPLLTL